MCNSKPEDFFPLTMLVRITKVTPKYIHFVRLHSLNEKEAVHRISHDDQFPYQELKEDGEYTVCSVKDKGIWYWTSTRPTTSVIK